MNAADGALGHQVRLAQPLLGAVGAHHVPALSQRHSLRVRVRLHANLAGLVALETLAKSLALFRKGVPLAFELTQSKILHLIGFASHFLSNVLSRGANKAVNEK